MSIKGLAAAPSANSIGYEVMWSEAEVSGINVQKVLPLTPYQIILTGNLTNAIIVIHKSCHF